MVDYEKEYDKFEDVPNNIDYGSWYEYDNFQDFIDGKNAMDLTSEDPDFMKLNLDSEELFDFNTLKDDELIYKEEYEEFLIDMKMKEEERQKNFLNSLEFEADYLNGRYDDEYLEYLESINEEEIHDQETENQILKEDFTEEMILDNLIQQHLLEEEELFKDFLSSKYAKKDAMDERVIEEYEDRFLPLDDFDDYDDEIDEKYYEFVDLMDDLHYKKIETEKARKDEDDSFNEISDYSDFGFGE